MRWFFLLALMLAFPGAVGAQLIRPAQVDTTQIMTTASPVAANVDMGGFKILDVLDPTDPQDAATKNYVDGAVAEITNSQTTETANTSTTSLTYVVVSGMTVTPAAGTYKVDFSASGNIDTAGALGNYALFVGGTIVAHTERDHSYPGTTTEVDRSLHTQAIVTPNGAEAVDVRYQTTDGTYTVHERSLILLRLGN